MIVGGYGVIFESTFTGSMFGAGPTRFAVWAFVCAKHREGLVELNPRLLAATLGTTSEDVTDALNFLCAPDKESRTPDYDGRRLFHVDGMTYGIANWPKYKELLATERRREQTREAMARLRERKQGSAEESNSEHPLSSVSNGEQPVSTSEGSVSPSTSTSTTELLTTPNNPIGLLGSAGTAERQEQPSLALEALEPPKGSTPIPKPPKRREAPASHQDPAVSWVAHIVEGISRLGEPIKGANPYGRVGAAFKERVRIFGEAEVRRAFDRFAVQRLNDLVSDRPVRGGYAYDDFDRDFSKYVPFDVLRKHGAPPASTKSGGPASDPSPRLPSGGNAE